MSGLIFSFLVDFGCSDLDGGLGFDLGYGWIPFSLWYFELGYGIFLFCAFMRGCDSYEFLSPGLWA